ncbi:MAG TPA: hypothetical protein PLR86_03355 [Planctomycetota bacterium]|nr:hypothetical protein [Planctomycetota bacterium]
MLWGVDFALGRLLWGGCSGEVALGSGFCSGEWILLWGVICCSGEWILLWGV